MVGAPLLLEVKDGETRHEYRLGANLLAGEHPQGLVPAGAWQTARSLGPWTLLGCTVAPGFEFSGFELAPEGFRALAIKRARFLTSPSWGGRCAA